MMQRGMSIQSTDATGTVTKAVDDNRPAPGQEVTFTITIKGSAPAGAVLEFGDSYPLEFLEPVEAAPGATYVVSSSNLNLGPIAYSTNPTRNRQGLYLSPIVVATGEYAATFTVTFTVSDQAAFGLVFVGTASLYHVVASWSSDLLGGAATSLMVLPVTGTVTLEKSGEYLAPSVEHPFGLVEWSVVVTNTGEGALTDVTVVDNTVADLDCDPRTAGFQTVIASIAEDAAAITCTGTTPLTLADGGQTLVNEASVTATSVLAADPVTDTARAEVLAPELPVTTPTAQPWLPTVTDGSCVDGVFTAATFTAQTTAQSEGIQAYHFSPDPYDLLSTGGEVTMTAMKYPGIPWGDVDSNIWTVSGNDATATITIVAPPCFTITKGAIINGALRTGDITVAPGDSFSWYVEVHHTGGPAATITLEDEFPFPFFVGGHGRSQALFPCPNPSRTGINCTVLVQPGASGGYQAGAQISSVYMAPDHCGGSHANTASITAINGEPASIASNTVTLTIDCPTVTPVLPAPTPGSCLNGVHTPPAFDPTPPDGVAYAYEPELAEALTTGGDLAITATMTGFTGWGSLDSAVWTVDGATATATVSIVVNSCATADLQPPQVTQASCLDGQPGSPTLALPADGGGVTYAADPAGPYTPGQTVVITATLDPTGAAWPDPLPGEWQRVDVLTATWTVNLTTPDCPRLVVTKTVTSASSDLDLHDVVTYEVVVANGGNVPLANISVTDPLVADLDCENAPGGVLATGEELTCTASHEISEDDIQTGSFTNTARAEGTGGADDQAVEDDAAVTVTTVKSRPVVTLESSVAPASLNAPGEVMFSFTIQNTGNLSLTGVAMTLSLADPTRVDCDPNADGVQPLPANLAASSDPVTCTVPYAVSQNQIDSGTAIANTARVTSDQVASNESSVTVSIVQQPGLSLSKTVDPVTVDTPGTVNYTFVIQNTGNVTLTNVALVDPAIDLAAVDCGPADGTQDVPSTLEVGSDAVTCTAPHEIDQDQFNLRQPIVNTAQVTSDQVDSAESSATLTIVPVDGLSLVVSVDPSSVDAPGEVVFTFVIANGGSASVNGVELAASLVDHALLDCDPSDGVQPVPGVLDAGEEVTCTAAYAIDQDDIDAGTALTTTAQVTSNQVDSNESSATVSIEQRPAMTLEKAVEPATVDTPGDVTYTFVIQNTGNVTLTSVMLQDPAVDVATLDCDPATNDIQLLAGSLAVGAEVACTVLYAIDQNDLEAGTPIENTAQVTSDQANSNEATATISILQQPDIAVTKTVTSATTDLDAGDIVTYAITVTNIGNVTLSDVEVHDPGANTIDCGTMPDTLVPDAVVECTASTELTEAHLLAGSYTNHVSVSATFRAAPADSQPQARTFSFIQTDPMQTVEASASATVTMRAVEVGLAIEKTVEPAEPVKEGATLTYTFVVTNTGNVGLDDVTIDDPLLGLVWDEAYPDGLIGTLPRGESVTVTATYEVTPGDVTAGQVANEAVAVAIDPTCEPDDDTLTFLQAAEDACALQSDTSRVTVETVAEPAPVTPESTDPAASPVDEVVTSLPETGQGQATPTGLAGLLAALAAVLAMAAGLTRRETTRT